MVESIGKWKRVNHAAEVKQDSVPRWSGIEFTLNGSFQGRSRPLDFSPSASRSSRIFNGFQEGLVSQLTLSHIISTFAPFEFRIAPLVAQMRGATKSRVRNAGMRSILILESVWAVRSENFSSVACSVPGLLHTQTRG